jgi:catechol 2,3-dioxygenase-like lactoylglutathione lyase family enzyme
MKIRGVDFVMYRVNDIGRAVAFYRDVLGLTLEFQSDEHQWAEFACGNVTLSLFGGSDITATGSAARVALAVDDIAAAHDELLARGVAMGGRPQDWGVCKSLEVFDPDGNAILLHHRADGAFGI